MYKIHLTKKFIKDAKNLSRREIEETMEVLEKLCSEQKLDDRYKDHALKGNLQGTRDCHITPDLVLIYKRDKEVLEIIALRIGKHSKLFKK